MTDTTNTKSDADLATEAETKVASDLGLDATTMPDDVKQEFTDSITRQEAAGHQGEDAVNATVNEAEAAIVGGFLGGDSSDGEGDDDQGSATA